MFRILGRPFEGVRADDEVSRRDECITGRERPESSLRGPGVILELFSGVVFFEGVNLPEWHTVRGLLGGLVRNDSRAVREA